MPDGLINMLLIYIEHIIIIILLLLVWCVWISASINASTIKKKLTYPNLYYNFVKYVQSMYKSISHVDIFIKSSKLNKKKKWKENIKTTSKSKYYLFVLKCLCEHGKFSILCIFLFYLLLLITISKVTGSAIITANISWNFMQHVDCFFFHYT